MRRRTTASSTRLNKRPYSIYITDMKRSLIAFACALFFVQPLFSFDTTRRAVQRITVLEAPRYDRSDDEDRLARRIRERLVRELRSRGVDAQDTGMTYDELQRRGTLDADLFVELTPADSSERSIADASVRVPTGAVDIAVVVSRVAAELRMYD